MVGIFFWEPWWPIQTIYLHPHHQMYHGGLWPMEIMSGMKLPHWELLKVSHLGLPNQTGQESSEGCCEDCGNQTHHMKCFSLKFYTFWSGHHNVFTNSVKLKLFLLQIFEARRLAEPLDFENFSPPMESDACQRPLKIWPHGNFYYENFEHQENFQLKFSTLSQVFEFQFRVPHIYASSWRQGGKLFCPTVQEENSICILWTLSALHSASTSLWTNMTSQTSSSLMQQL